MTNALLIDSAGIHEITHPLTLDAMQATVGGYIDVAFTIDGPIRGRSITGYVNDEGLLIGLDPVLYVEQSRQTLVGPCLVVGLNTRNGETVPLDAEELAFIQGNLRRGVVATSDAYYPVHVLTD